MKKIINILKSLFIVDCLEQTNNTEFNNSFNQYNQIMGL